MKLNLETIKSTVKSIPNKTIQETGKIGSYAFEFGNKVLKKDTYVKPETFKLKNKETILGFGLFAGALVLAAGCIKGIHNKIKEARKG